MDLYKNKISKKAFRKSTREGIVLRRVGNPRTIKEINSRIVKRSVYPSRVSYQVSLHTHSIGYHAHLLLHWSSLTVLYRPLVRWSIRYQKLLHALQPVCEERAQTLNKNCFDLSFHIIYSRFVYTVLASCSDYLRFKINPHSVAHRDGYTSNHYICQLLLFHCILGRTIFYVPANMKTAPCSHLHLHLTARRAPELGKARSKQLMALDCELDTIGNAGGLHLGGERDLLQNDDYDPSKYRILDANFLFEINVLEKKMQRCSNI